MLNKRSFKISVKQGPRGVHVKVVSNKKDVAKGYASRDTMTCDVCSLIKNYRRCWKRGTKNLRRRVALCLAWDYSFNEGRQHAK